jgi:O-6-methylguanine DNA methyltransferase
MGAGELGTGDDKVAGPGLIVTASIPTPIGRIHVASTSTGVARIELPDPNAGLRMNVWLALHFPELSIRPGVTPILKRAISQLAAYFTAARTEFSFPFDMRGTAFQMAVWQRVLKIPFGETSTYSEIAAATGNPRAVCAVGTAQAANPLPIVVPCHRVIGADGRLTGYAGGLEVKRWLLDHEAKREERSHAVPRPARTQETGRISRLPIIGPRKRPRPRA